MQTTRVHPQSPQQGSLGRLFLPALDKIVKNCSWKRDSALVEACKNVKDWFGDPIVTSLPQISSLLLSEAPLVGNLPPGDEAEGTEVNIIVESTQTEASLPIRTPLVPFSDPTFDGEADGLYHEFRRQSSAPMLRELSFSEEFSMPLLPADAGGASPECFPSPCESPVNSLSRPGFRPVAWDSLPGLFLDSKNMHPVPDADFLLRPLHLACASSNAHIVEPALDCLQKLIHLGFLRGDVDPAYEGESSGVLEAVLASLKYCFEKSEDTSLEILALKSVLTAAVSPTLRLHKKRLLEIVRLCQRAYLKSKNTTVQMSSKGAIMQILALVLVRVEENSPSASVPVLVMRNYYKKPASDVQFAQTLLSSAVPLGTAASMKPPGLITMMRAGYIEPEAGQGGGFQSDKAKKDVEDVDAMYMKRAAAANQDVILALGHALVHGQVPDKPSVREPMTPLEEDALLLLQEVCSSCQRTALNSGAEDSQSVLSEKLLGLELLQVALEYAGAASTRVLSLLRHQIFLSLLENGFSVPYSLYQPSCSVFLRLLARFRPMLKHKIADLFPHVIVKVLQETAHPVFAKKFVAMNMVEHLCLEPQILVDLFVNYDCDVDAPDLFEGIMSGLLKTCQGAPHGKTDGVLHPAQRYALRLEATRCLLAVLQAMATWANRQLHLCDTTSTRDYDASSEGGDSVSSGLPEGLETPDREESIAESSDPWGHIVRTEAITFDGRRTYKRELQDGISLFNRSPAKGLAMMIEKKKVGDSPSDVAYFLKTCPQLNKTQVGEYLGERDEAAMAVMHAYVETFDFQGREIDDALRHFLNHFRLPGESQKINRIVEKFAEQFCRCNPDVFGSAVTAHVLSYSIIMLNTDAHNPAVKSKMTKEEFVRNNGGIDEGKDLPSELLSAIFDRIVASEIRWKEDSKAKGSHGAAGKLQRRLSSSKLRSSTRLRDLQRVHEIEDQMRALQEQFAAARESSSSGGFYIASDPDLIRSMVEVAWTPALLMLNVRATAGKYFGNFDDGMGSVYVLEGFRVAIHVTQLMGMKEQRDAFFMAMNTFTANNSAAKGRRARTGAGFHVRRKSLSLDYEKLAGGAGRSYLSLMDICSWCGPERSSKL